MKIKMPHRLARHFWWRRVDSNHRSESQQIYSLPPLATRELLHMNLWARARAAPGEGRAAPAERRENGSLQKMELVDGFEPPTC